MSVKISRYTYIRYLIWEEIRVNAICETRRRFEGLPWDETIRVAEFRETRIEYLKSSS